MNEKTKKSEKKENNREVIVKLEYHVEWGSEMIEEITLRRPLAGDIEHLSDKPTMKELLIVASKCSQHPPALIKRIDAKDALKLVEVIGDFLGSGLETGDKDW